AAHKGQPLPTFGIEAVEKLSDRAQQVTPGAGLATTEADASSEFSFSRKELAAFYELVQSVNAARSRDELINSFVEKLSFAVEHETCALTLIDANSGEIIVEHARGAHAAGIQG